MGLFTDVSLAEARRLGAEFGVDIDRVEALPAGSVNSNFRFHGAGGQRYFARVYEEQGMDGAQRERRLLRELSQAGVPTTVPLPQKDESFMAATSGGKPFALYPWVDGEILCQARVSAAHAREVGRALALLHLATPRVTPLPLGRFRIEDLSVRLDRIEQGSPEHRDAALYVRGRLRHYAGLRDAGLPTGVIHGDLFRDNVLWQGERIGALIDFESASNGPYAFDVMVTLLAWCYGDRFESELIGALFSGYESERPLLPLERAALPVEGALACLRFATTRITDFSMRAAPGEPPLRDYRRFLARLDELERGVLEAHTGDGSR